MARETAPVKVGQKVRRRANPEGAVFIIIGEATEDWPLAYATQHGLPHPLKQRRSGWHVQDINNPRFLATYPTSDLEVVP